jgi:ketosteroid isomerase-like protein
MTRFTVLAGALFTTIGAGALLAPPARGADVGPDFKALFRKTAAAWQTLDPSKAAPLYAKDATLAFFDLAPLKYTGWGEYASGAAEMFSGFSSINITLNDDLQSQRRGNVAWGTTTGRIDVVNKDGSKLPLDVRWTLIWEKRGSDWLIVHEHASTPLAMPAPPATKK